jgi:hypothetical protein
MVVSSTLSNGNHDGHILDFIKTLYGTIQWLFLYIVGSIKSLMIKKNILFIFT